MNKQVESDNSSLININMDLGGMTDRSDENKFKKGSDSLVKADISNIYSKPKDASSDSQQKGKFSGYFEDSLGNSDEIIRNQEKKVKFN